MRQTEFLRHLVTVLVFAFTAVNPALAREGTLTAAQSWEKSLAAPSYGALIESYDVLEKLQDDSGDTRTDQCAELQSTLDQAVQSNPASLALQLAAADCANVANDRSAAERHTQIFAELVRLAIAELPADYGETPIEVISEWDVMAFIRASGEVPIYYYYDQRQGTFPLNLRVALLDRERETERWLSFDYFKTAMHFFRNDPTARFPLFQQQFVYSVLANWAESSRSITLDASAVQTALENSPLAARLQALARLGAQGNIGAVFRYAGYCAYSRSADCETTATDLLLPLAEVRSARAMILLAVLKADPAASRADEKSARILLDNADRRLGNHVASAEFAAIMDTRNARAKLSSFARKRLKQAGKAGNPEAEWLIALHERRANSSGSKLSTKARAGLMHAAQSGFPNAEALLASELWREGDKAQAIRWMQVAGAHRSVSAQSWLAMAYADGNGVETDLDKATYWRQRAARNGDIESMLWLAGHYRKADQTVETRQLQEGWLLSAAATDNVDAMIALADLYRIGGEGLKSGPVLAERLYRKVLETQDRADARRGLAALLFGTDGVEQNRDEARKLLNADAEKDDPLSQTDLGVHIINGDFGTIDQTGRAWLKKASDRGDARASANLGIALYYDSDGGGRDPAAAIVYLSKAAENGNDDARNNLAWVLCTVDQEPLRDPQRGLSVIRVLIGERSVNPVAWIDTYAACQAASGHFDEAVRLEEQAIAAARKNNPSNLKAIKRLETYAAGYRKSQPLIEHPARK
ncbi:MAG TPA: tetratricopeptide repeat protein [Dokdonella sp.]|uniref:SEL1-like repeat protein n=1 Tax=Dokdonella sp. TaxID=2291710 RepID=UPI002D7E83DC|nr:tetratricopeptide repeat protein [Dokdonella sp.]HET9033848.1 tetratricopeptide repeat protein [Dokdonella sp.]